LTLLFQALFSCFRHVDAWSHTISFKPPLSKGAAYETGFPIKQGHDSRAITAIGTLLIATNVPGIAAGLKVTASTLTDWAVVIIAAVTARSGLKSGKYSKRALSF